MHPSVNEISRLKKAQYFVKSNFPHFGVNKSREIVRLLYEISKKYSLELDAFVPRQELREGYSSLKDSLLKIRYPNFYSPDLHRKVFLPAIDFQSAWESRSSEKFLPSTIFFEASVSHSALLQRLKKLYPQAHFKEIPSLKSYMNEHRDSSIIAYNRRQKSVFVVKENYDFFRACPCTKNTVSCGYHIFNLGFGCIHDCTYCYLQWYANTAGIILPANLADFFDNFYRYQKPGMRIGSGEFTDSLALDHVTEFSPELIAFFKKHKEVTFEFKTKSDNVKNLLSLKAPSNIVVSWSLNPQSVIEKNEFCTASLERRLKAAHACAEAGYRLGLHFDPVIYYDGWEGEYRALIDKIFRSVPGQNIAWISIGTLRFHPEMKPLVEKRFPDNTILDEEFVMDFDGKMRYPAKLRYEIYKTMLDLLRAKAPDVFIYLCMEQREMWEAVHRA